MKRIEAKPQLWVVFVMAVTGLVGCAQHGSVGDEARGENAGKLEQVISDGLSAANSDWQVEVLSRAQESGNISEQDWKEANSRYLACVEDKGYSGEIIYEGAEAFLQTEVDPGLSEAEMVAEDMKTQVDTLECYDKTSAYINEAYLYLNGGLADTDVDSLQRAVLACLIDGDLVPKETTYEEFAADLEQNDGKQFMPNGQANETAIAKCWEENS